MTTIGKLKQIRKGHRMCADKLMAQVNGDKKLNYDKMKVMLASLDSREGKLKKCDSDILDALTDEGQILEEIQDASDYGDLVISAKTKLELEIRYHDKKSSGSDAN